MHGFTPQELEAMKPSQIIEPGLIRTQQDIQTAVRHAVSEIQQAAVKGASDVSIDCPQHADEVYEVLKHLDYNVTLTPNRDDEGGHASPTLFVTWGGRRGGHLR